jgi:hypothetical protein
VASCHYQVKVTLSSSSFENLQNMWQELFHRRTPIMLSFGHAKDWTLAKYHGFRKQTR